MTAKTDELIKKACDAITLAAHPPEKKVLNEKEYVRLSSGNKPTEEMSKLDHRKSDKRVQKKEE